MAEPIEVTDPPRLVVLFSTCLVGMLFGFSLGLAVGDKSADLAAKDALYQQCSADKAAALEVIRKNRNFWDDK